VRTSNLVPFIAVQFILGSCVLHSKEMFGPWRLWDDILSRFLPRYSNKRCQTDHWPLYNDSYSHTVIPWSLPSVLGAVISKQQWPTAKFLTVALLVLQIIWNVFSPLVMLVCTLQMHFFSFLYRTRIKTQK